MIMYISDTGLSSGNSLCEVREEELSQLDKLIAFTTSKLLAKYVSSNTNESWPSDFVNFQEWINSVEEHSIALKEYTRIDTYKDTQEAKVIEDAKKAFRFIAEYLDEIYE